MTNFEPHGFTIFCDDLRSETSGKTTYVGVYGDVMYVNQELPITLPKLCMAIHLFSDPDDRPSKILIQAALPGEKIEDASVRVELSPDMKMLELPDIGDPLTHPRAHIVVNLDGAAFKVKQFGRIRVSAMWDDKFVPLGSLAIAPIPADHPAKN